MLTVFTVDSIFDNTIADGFTTLREAINFANQDNLPDQIIFANSLANQTINIQLGNLVINERVTITGPSTGLVFINDASATADTGLTFSGFDLNPAGVFGGTAVSGLVIDGFENGIKLQNLTSGGFDFTLPFRIEDNFIQNVSNTGIFLSNANVPFEIHGNTILGTGTGIVNVGIFIDNSGQFDSGGSVIVNFPNPIGNIGNFDNGTGNAIGGFKNGIEVQRSFFPDMRISNNLIGSQTLPNTGAGILDSLTHHNAPNTTGIGRIDNNAITFNGSEGIAARFLDGTVIEDNYLGDNGGIGISLGPGSEDFTIRRNTFDSNALDAIRLFTNTGNGGAGLRNRFSENDFLGVNVAAGHQAIDLGSDGFTANDFNDLDAGPNDTQNFAIVVDAEISELNGIWTIPVEFDARLGNAGNYRLEFYRYNVATGSFQFIRAVTENITNTGAANDLDKTYDFVSGAELSDGDRIGVVAIQENNANFGFNNTSELSLSSLSAVLPDSGAPKITGVAIAGPNLLDGNRTPADGFYDIPSGDGNQIRTVPIGGADIIQITFDEAVNIATLPNAFSLTGAFTGTDYTTQVVYQGFDPLSNTATWEYTPNIATDQFPVDQMVLTLADTITDASGNLLDGEWTSPMFLTDTGTSTFPSGDGTAGGAFMFYFTILPGDVAGGGPNGTIPDNIINASTDGSVLLANLGTTSGASYNNNDLKADLNGDGAVTASGDGAIFLNNLNDPDRDFTTWPGALLASSSGGGSGPRTLAATDAAFSNFSSLLDSLAGGLGSALAVV